MRPVVVLLVTLAAAAPLVASAESAFVRPACPVQDRQYSAEERCIADLRRQVQQSNFEALQKTGLMFRYMARPDLDQHPEAKAAIEKEIEGSFVVRFDVAADGTVYNVREIDVTAGIEPLARMWADTIRQWTFVKTGNVVAGIEHRRIYLYPRESEADPGEKLRSGP